MARPPREAASPSALGPALLRYATTHGADASLIAARAGIDPSDADKDEIPLTTDAVVTMLADLSELLADPHLALRLPGALSFRRFDAGALAARVAATPRDVLAAIARFAALVFPRLEAEVREDEDEDEEGEVSFHARIVTASGGSRRAPKKKIEHHAHEYVVAFALAHCRRGNTTILPRRAWLASPRPAGDLGALVRAIGTDEIELGAEDTGFALSRADASIALPAFDPMLVAAAEHLATAALATAPRPGALGSAVAAKIEALLPADVSADAIAAAMRMSSRTLQRRLEDEGIRFSALLDQVRERVAKRLLLLHDEKALALAEIGYRVGFSDLATFSRAFKRWTGMPPGAFRRRRETT